jgi:hypothetical protein
LKTNHLATLQASMVAKHLTFIFFIRHGSQFFQVGQI